jgi:hypothetical protein
MAEDLQRGEESDGLYCVGLRRSSGKGSRKFSFREWSNWFLSDSDGPDVFLLEFAYRQHEKELVACYLFFWDQEEYQDFLKFSSEKFKDVVRPALPWKKFGNRVVFFRGTFKEAEALLRQYEPDSEFGDFGC